MSKRRREGKVRFSIVEESREVVAMGQGWTTNAWAVADVSDSSGTLPRFRARAEIVRSGKRTKAVITEIHLGGHGEAVLQRQVTALAKLMPDLPAEILWLVTLPEPDTQPSWEDFVRAMRAAVRNPNLTQFEREDEVLRLWEGKYEPGGMNQREAAADMGLTHNTFRTYLAHARARRK